MGTANSVIDERLHKLIGDWIEEDVTTALTATAVVLSTNLNLWDDARDDRFNNYWVYVTEFANAGQDRKIYDYVTTGGSCAVRGAVFSVEGAESTIMATCRFYKYSWTMGQHAISDAIREIGSDVLFRNIDDRSLVTGNILPDGHFEDWTSSSALTWYTKAATATLTKTGTAGSYRGANNTYSMKVAAGGADCYAQINSDTYPRLLDLKGKSIDMAVWAKASSTDDAFMDVVSTIAGATSTVSSTTSCTADIFCLLKREAIAISSGITKIEFRFRVHTNTEDAYFDNARVNGRSIQEFMLPEPLQDGEVMQVYIQSSGYSDYACDDLMPASWDRIYGSTFYDDGTYNFLRLPALYSDNRQIRLIGTSPLSEASTVAGTASFASSIEVSGREVDLLVTYAAYCLFRNEEGVPSSEDTSRYTSRAYKYLREYERLKPSLRKTKPSGTLNLPRAY